MISRVSHVWSQLTYLTFWKLMKKVLEQKIACSWFFIAPALAYGLFTSRLPAIKQAIHANDGQIGILMLGLGVATLIGLSLGGIFIDRFGAKKMTSIAIGTLLIAITLVTLALGYGQVLGCCLIAGLGVGFCDVGMNALGLQLERKYNVNCMSFLHAVCSLGGVAGALSGSIFASLGFSPFINALCVLGAYLLLFPFAARRIEDQMEEQEAKKYGWGSLPLFVFICGVLGLLCHIAEGSTGEWGSIFLHSVKGAPQQEAALVFAVFTGTMVFSRFCADRLRYVCGDFILLLGGSLMGAAGMCLVLLASSVLLCLAGYGIMGLGLGPIVPILFSRAGAVPGVTAGQASAVVSVFSYAGLLFFPPFLGFLAQTAGLANALWVIVAICLLQALGAPVFLKRKN